jgi:RNA polymerase sigma-70 factor (ECF subfamily)
MKRQIDATKRLIEDCLLEAKGSEDRLPLHLLYEDVVHTEEFILLSEMALEGKSHKEMAAARGITVNTCKKRVQRAREMLQKKIKK